MSEEQRHKIAIAKLGKANPVLSLTRKRLFAEGKLKTWSEGLTSEDPRIKKFIIAGNNSIRGKPAWNRGISQPATPGSWKPGNVPWNAGRHDLPSTWNLGKKMSLIHRRGISNSRKGKKIPETIKLKMSNSHKKLWRNPAYARKRMSKFGKHPNDIERWLDAFLQLHFPKEWKYVGDGKVWIEGKNPDFINCNGKKIVLEYNGYYKHWRFGTEKDEEKTRHYAQYGYSTINLYPDDLKDLDILKGMIMKGGRIK